MADRLRWPVAGAPTDALFDAEALAGHHVGGGEWAGYEFLEVNAKTLINTLPASSRMPFRHTINVYRGCSHACSYCVSGDTKVLMADGRNRPIADIRPGDIVVGTVEVERYQRYFPTMVTDHWTTTKPAFRVTLANGTSIVASGDHRFLTRRGWKHVTGGTCGAGQRPHLTLNDRMVGPGHPVADALVIDDEYRRGYLCGMVRGDANLKRYSYERDGRTRVVHRFRLALADAEALERSAEYLNGFGVPTTSAPFATPVGCRPMTMIRNSTRAAFEAVHDIIAWPGQPSGQWRRGYLAGFFDAEGSCSRGVLRFSNKSTQMLDHAARALDEAGFSTTLEGPNDNGVLNLRVLGGLHERLRLFDHIEPAISRKLDVTGAAVKGSADLRVVRIEPLPGQMTLYDITTGTGNFIANGVISHNCFARPTHEYLGLDIGDDFERKIVVKVNAVERLRAELSAKRWAGDHIAMGTNTDPYQRCEGRYRLTRGVVEALVEHENPFSILTKSTLVLRDLDLLVEAARRCDAHVNLSIGTLDESVWRLTEPGTPSPRLRVEAVRRLNEAGVPCGVLIAPVLPGLSDAPAQLREVVDAVVGAGATSVSTVMLYLRPGVRELYLERLRARDPSLAAALDERYVRSHLPKADEKALSDQVRELVAGARRRLGRPAGRYIEGGFAERVQAQTGAAPVVPAREVAPAAEQLGWEL